MKNIVLIGMPGCGKSTIGTILAEKLQMTFVDMDAYIEETMGTTITEIFKNGEPYFREIEARIAKELSEREGTIISTGGGIVKNPDNCMNLRKNGIIVYINRPVDNIAADIDAETRPLLAKDPSQLYRLYEERSHLYEKYCDYNVPNTTDLDAVVDDIIKIYKEL